MRKSMIILALVVAVVAGACAQDVMSSHEYQALEAENAALESRLAEVAAERDAARAVQPVSSTERHDKASAVMTEIAAILADPDGFGSEEEIVDAIATHATESAVMDDEVFGAVGYRSAFFNTLFGGATDARIDVHHMWLSDDGSQGGFLWMWSGTNATGRPFELAGISLTDFADDGRIAYELVTYPYSDEYVREAFRGGGTSTPSTGS